MSEKKLEAKHSGVYRTPAHADSLRKAAAQAGLAWIDLPLQRVSTKKQFLAVCAKQLKLPSYFGGNWDALGDCVRDFNWLEGAGYVLHLSACEKFALAAPDDFAIALAVLQEAAAFWLDSGTPFIVFVDEANNLPAY